ncbi:MAG: GNAT family N-acetyltransferase [Tannerella sp.]|nr:GNAT family N-acetyltransferase [Tannerella sp.]
MMSKETYHKLCLTEESIPVFSQDWWLDAVCGAANWNVLLIEENNRTLAAWPRYMPRPHLVTMPSYTQTMGIWFAPPAADAKYTSVLERRQALCKQFISRSSTRSFLQNFPYTFTDWLPFYWNGYRQTTRYTYLLQDLKDADRLRNNMSQNLRRNIRKAQEQYHVSVRQGVSVEDFLQVQKLTFDRQGKKNTQSADALRRLIDVCRERGQGELWGGYDDDGHLHAVAFVAWQKSSAYYVAGGGDPEFRHSGAHSLVLREAIRFVSDRSDVFNFDGSMVPGIERFFREFGAIQTPYFTLSKGKPSLIDRALIRFKRFNDAKHP